MWLRLLSKFLLQLQKAVLYPPVVANNMGNNIGMPQSDHVIGNQAWLRSFRLNQNQTLPPDQDSDIYVLGL